MFKECLERTDMILCYRLWSLFSGGSNGKESACNVIDPFSIPGSGRCPGEGNGNPFQSSCLESSMNRGDWGVLLDCKELDTTK